MSVKIQKGLNSLFDEITDKNFQYSKLEFEKTFEKLYARYQEVFTTIQEAVDTAEDKEKIIKEIAAYIPEHVEEKSAALSKRKKEVLFVDYNMKLATFILPMLNRTESGEGISEALLESWNQKFDQSMKNAGYEQIESGFKQRLCYITTAVCKNQNKPDDCYELQMLRAYRDDYLIGECHEDALIEAYYRVAPAIVESIDALAENSQIYKDILETYIQPCISYIEAGQKEACKQLYIEMVHTLQEKYLKS